jgi:LysR family transcriptional regulator (chromosome initiation inhibitor)
MSNFDPDALECLAAIVEEGGFERAAVRLSITQSAVSQRLRSLETQVGTVLVVRSRPLRPTAAGRLMLKHAMQMRLLRADLDHDLKELAPSAASGGREEDRISVAINADSIATWALPALDGLAREGLALEIIADDQDFTQDWLREGQVLGCVTTLRPALRGCKVVPLGAMNYVAVASADFARAHCADGLTRHNFRSIPFIAFNRKDDLQAEFVSRAFNLKRVSLSQRFVPSSEGQVRAALAGWGATVVPELQVRPLLAAKQLVDLAPGQVLPVELYWHCWNLDSAVLDSLTHALTTAAALALVPPAKA